MALANTVEDTSSQYIASSLHKRHTIATIDGVSQKLYAIPFLKAKTINFHHVPINEKVWVLNEDSVPYDSSKEIDINTNFTIIHGINHLNDHYEITVYKVVPFQNGFKGIISYNEHFSKGSIKINPAYKSFATRLTLMT